MRSLTAEHMYRGFRDYQARSAGTSAEASTRVDKERIDWADVIFVMEEEHAKTLRGNFRDDLSGKSVICLNIPDLYRYMEPALIDELKTKLADYL
jgi:predicted protein tyrosine phosphatase